MDSVDILVVLAIDVSGSLGDDRIMLQRDGHARAIRSDAFLQAVALGHHGRAALTVVEWSNHDRQDQLVPWTVIGDRAGAERFGATLLAAPRPMPGYTSISGAIDFGLRLFCTAPFAAERQVIDISGNGPCNDGRPVEEARDAAVAAGVTINGLPILDAVADLDGYFAEKVIGGPGAFMVVARDPESFAEAIRRKLVTEIADRPGIVPGRRIAEERRSRPVAAGYTAADPAGRAGVRT